jgi:hypothetical protein
MKRYQVLELYFPSDLQPRQQPVERQVHETDTLEEAEAWIDTQDPPENIDFEIVDQYEDLGDEDFDVDDIVDEDFEDLLPNPVVPLDRDYDDDEVDLPPFEEEDEDSFDRYGSNNSYFQ